MVEARRTVRKRSKAKRVMRKAPGVDDLEPAEAIEVLRRLTRKRGAVAQAVRDEIRKIVAAADMEGVAAETYRALEDLAVEDLWDRSGRTPRGYRDPSEEAWIMIEDVLRLYVDRVEQYQRWGMREQARQYCLNVLHGIARYVRDADTEFKNWAQDDPSEAAAWVLDSWKKGETDQNALELMDREFVHYFRSN